LRRHGVNLLGVAILAIDKVSQAHDVTKHAGDDNKSRRGSGWPRT
jgi:hypothetical protein